MSGRCDQGHHRTCHHGRRRMGAWSARAASGHEQRDRRGRNPSMSILINGGIVVTGTGEIHDGWDVLIEGDRIAAVGPGLAAAPEGRGAERIDARRAIVMPGLINAHIHSNESFEQGATDNLPLELWRLRTYPPFD